MTANLLSRMLRIRHGNLPHRQVATVRPTGRLLKMASARVDRGTIALFTGSFTVICNQEKTETLYYSVLLFSVTPSVIGTAAASEFFLDPEGAGVLPFWKYPGAPGTDTKNLTSSLWPWYDTWTRLGLQKGTICETPLRFDGTKEVAAASGPTQNNAE